MKGIILAAGNGGRLRPLTLETPKVLLGVGGWPLIHYPISAMSDGGVTEIMVIVGHNREMVEESLGTLYPDILFRYNENHAGGNALSIGVAREFVDGEKFVVCMGDHPISNQIVRNLLSNSWDRNTLCIDSMATQPEQLNDATRVFVDDDGYIVEIGKGLRIWNAIDIGVFQMTPEVFSVIDMLMRRQGLEVEISDVVRHMGSKGRPFSTCDVEGEFWSDVDTLDDYSALTNRMN